MHGKILRGAPYLILIIFISVLEMGRVSADYCYQTQIVANGCNITLCNSDSDCQKGESCTCGRELAWLGCNLCVPSGQSCPKSKSVCHMGTFKDKDKTD